MKASRRDIAEAVVSLAVKTGDRTRVAQALAFYLVQEHRVRDLDAIMREAIRLREQRDGIIEAEVITAFPLDDAMAPQIKQLIKSMKPGLQNVVLDTQVNPSVLGGVDIHTREYEFDATLRTKLLKLKNLTA